MNSTRSILIDNFDHCIWNFFDDAKKSLEKLLNFGNFLRIFRGKILKKTQGLFWKIKTWSIIYACLRKKTEIIRGGNLKKIQSRKSTYNSRTNPGDRFELNIRRITSENSINLPNWYEIFIFLDFSRNFLREIPEQWNTGIVE